MNCLRLGPTHFQGGDASSISGIRILGLKKALESVDDLSQILVSREPSGEYQCYNKSEVNSTNTDASLAQFIVTNIKNIADLKQFKIAHIYTISSIANKTLNGAQHQNAQNLLKLIEDLFIDELNQWETEGNKAEAIRRIIYAYRNKSETLDLSNLGLTSLPPLIGLLIQLKTLDISHNKLGSLPSWIGYLVELVELYLGYNLFPSLPTGIGNLTALTKLDVSFNQLRWLPDSIGKLTALSSLYVQKNQLRSLPDSIGNLTALSILWINGNQLRSLPDSIGKLSALTKLLAYNNQLRFLPDSIGTLSALTELGVSENQLSSLPNSIGNLTALTGLFVGKNQLLSLPDSIGTLSALTELGVRSNHLRSLPDSIGNLIALTKLDVRSNQLRFLPDSIGNLIALTNLDVRRNQLRSLPDSIGNLIALTNLGVSRNELRFLPDSIGNLIALDVLDFFSNELRFLPDSIGNLTGLVELDLSFNKLPSLPDSIGNLTGLVELDLSYNQLRFLPNSIGNLTRLMELNLSHNQLPSLPNSINNLISLTYLDYTDNLLEEDPELHLPNLILHFAYSNPFFNLFYLCNPFHTARLRQARARDNCVNRLLNAFRTAAKEDTSSGLNLTQLNLERNGNLHLWLDGCIHSKEWKTPRTKENFAKGILEIVRYAEADESYRETFNSVLADRTCSDRATLAYDTLKLKMEMAKLGPDAEEGQVVAIFKRDFVADKLTQIAYDMTPELEERARVKDKAFDQISAVLAYRQNVGEMLGISIGSETMTFVDMAHLGEGDYKTAKKMVDEDLKKIDPVAHRFLQNTAWINYIDNKYALEKEKALCEQANKMDELDAKSRGMTDGDYDNMANQLAKEYNTLESKWRLEMTKAILGNVTKSDSEVTSKVEIH